MKRLLALLLIFLLPVVAQSHEIRPAFLQMSETEPQRFEVVWKQPVLADRRLAIDPILPDDCVRVSERLPEHTGSALIERWVTSCTLKIGSIEISGLSATLTDVVLRITYRDGDTVNHILRPSTPRLSLAEATPGIVGYFVLGIEHLLFGIDHILFVVGLVLFIRTPWELVKAVTAFTVAHSVTLALSVLGLVKLPQGPVEAVIALSILFLAREIMIPEVERSRIARSAPWVMALAFGLLHGFGFAGALLDIGLPRDQLAASLLLFNVGIEIGQLVVIGIMLLVGWLLKRVLEGRALLVERGFSAAMGCAAAFWTVDRVVALA